MEFLNSIHLTVKNTLGIIITYIPFLILTFYNYMPYYFEVSEIVFYSLIATYAFWIYVISTFAHSAMFDKKTIFPDSNLDKFFIQSLHIVMSICLTWLFLYISSIFGENMFNIEILFWIFFSFLTLLIKFLSYKWTLNILKIKKSKSN